ncbi:MAG TPA: bifunctional diaminohydroxyphosphoribosylaminopyrimidine deaminase/5-amino-6-(5-phosphoribosylamino)uracil reductase RibD [Gammaproteobacteria bacterium]|nr:bifunctional diaminohydroxyphosphoribosylaminopyrimidine deaminase/5-amino-6-(5-phosphoribosylamino)uracil reductase RibD [Gammaproteobacteria bacterium]
MTAFSEADHAHMARAVRLASKGLYTTDPNPRVGCVLVADGEVVGEGWHEYAGGPHAEVHALEQAGEKARDATAYVTLEPCCHHGRTGPCSDALVEAGVARVVVAAGDPNPRVSGEGLGRLQAAGIEVEEGLLRGQAEALNPGFVRRMRDGRPFVRSKLAMSLDGRTAMASGESRWITSEAARTDVHRLRARSSAIVTGIGTVLADDPSLTVRLEDLPEPRQPLRVVLDPRLSLPESARMLSLPGRTLVVTAADDPEQQERLEAAGAEVLRLPGGPDSIDLPAMLEELGRREVNEVLLETGATLSGAMLQAGLLDEIVVYMAPLLMGDGARGLFHLPGLEEMAGRVELEIDEMRAVGRDWRITATVSEI